MHSTDECIAAVASAAGGGARGTVRISGVGVADVLSRCFVARDFDPARIGRARAVVGLVRLCEPEIDLPCRLYYWPTPRSYTGQPSAELQTIGSPPLLESLLDTVRAAGARLARPGEFTLRAFLAGRIDLTQAEAVLGVIDARSDAELASALEQLAGGIAEPLWALRSELLDLLADLEAGLDFVDEDIAFITPEALVDRLTTVRKSVDELAAQLRERDASSELPRVVLVGPPNAGKSSLFNALVGSGQAIVADIPGTTRDYLLATIDLDGIRCELCDTAGVEASDGDEVVTSAQTQRGQAQRRADIELHCRDASDEQGMLSGSALNVDQTRLIVRTKADLAQKSPSNDLSTSVVTGVGLDALRAAIRAAVQRLDRHDGGPRATAARCRGTLDDAVAALDRARRLVVASLGDELVAAEIRAALQSLGEVAGAVYTNDLLDRVFSRFCIGK
ncbi:MAG: GTPase [Planctomycetia bacterium]|nr:GTPase [Planctomycetia bacterium]